MMERDRPENTSREEYVVRPGETHVVRGATPSAREEVSGLQSSDIGATTAGADEEATTEEIRADIEQTRAELSETIDAIQEKLAPDTLKEQAKEVVRDATVGRAEQALGDAQETVREAGTGIMDMIKQNPIPVAMVGLGLGWLWFNRQRQSSESEYQRGYSGGSGRGSIRYGETRVRGSRFGTPGYGNREAAYNPRYYEEYESGGGGRGPQERVGEIAGQAQGRVRDVAGEAQGRVSDMAGRAQETVGELAGRTGETAGELAGRAQETVGELTDQARYQMERARGGFQQQLMENPFALGALALGLGVAVGLAVPETRREDQLLGEARDNLLGQAQSAMQDTGQRVQHVAERVQQQVQEESQS